MKKLDKEKLASMFTSDNARMVFIFLGLGAILLIFISGFIGDNSNDKNIEKELIASDYSESLSTKLVDMIEKIQGVGEAQVLLTLENSYEYVYLDDDKTLSKIIEPKVRGVAVVCTGGDDPVIIEKVTKMLATVLSVSSGKISVSKLR